MTRLFAAVLIACVSSCGGGTPSFAAGAEPPVVDRYPIQRWSKVKHYRKAYRVRTAKIRRIEKPDIFGGYARKTFGRSVSLAGVVPELVAKTREIQSACGSIVISAVAGRPNRSNHPIGRAVDMQGNPSCIYAHLRNWPGGYSTDYHTVRCGGLRCPHVHISYNPGGQEWGVRFAHRNPYSYARRYRGPRG